VVFYYNGAGIKMMHTANGAAHHTLQPKQPMDIIIVHKYVKLLCTHYAVHITKINMFAILPPLRPLIDEPVKSTYTRNFHTQWGTSLNPHIPIRNEHCEAQNAKFILICTYAMPFKFLVFCISLKGKAIPVQAWRSGGG